MNKKMTFQDIKDYESWRDYVHQEAYQGSPEKFTHKDQWDRAEWFVLGTLTDEQYDKLTQLEIVEKIEKKLGKEERELLEDIISAIWSIQEELEEIKKIFIKEQKERTLERERKRYCK